MIVTGRPGRTAAHHHAGYVAGCYRDGARSDTWTDVARCARGTFVRYVPACTCGWYGSARPSTTSGFRDCQRELVTGHLGALAGAGAGTAIAGS
jgi:hypothetical protein